MEKEVQQKNESLVKKICVRWFITAFSGMAQGLFCTLIAGTIFALIARIFGDSYIAYLLNKIAEMAKSATGIGIGVGIGYSLSKNKLVVFSAGIAGFVGGYAKEIVLGAEFKGFGNPIGAYVVALLAIELVELYQGKTKLDIVLVPLGVMFISAIGVFTAYPFIWAVDKLGLFISVATEFTPFFMGIIISVIMGILLTMPTSSAAIWLAVVGANGTDSGLLLAGGAAVVGCACHMVGFAVASYRENGVSGLISQGLGTSMLQIPNIMKKPIIMLPAIISSAILGPIATCIFKLNCDATGGGMGTSGLVGMFGVIDANPNMNIFILITAIVLLLFVLPALISLIVSELMRKKGLIKFGDMKL